MEKADNEMYALVDEEFLAKFSNQHLNYMKKLYYSFYECFLLGKHTVERVCSGLSPLRRDRLWC